MSTVRDRYDNILNDSIFKQWCKKIGIRATAPSSISRWKKGVSEGTIFALGHVLFDNSNPHEAFQITLEVK